ncbi:MAG: hypothetical protein HY231_24130 [Acidobacteria bacterium]|nr:hypothetical protein [Acidobacteriota bacterium]
MKTVYPFAEQGNFTQQHNLTYDVMMRMLSPSAWMILCFILRNTKGFHREKVPLSYTDFLEGTSIKSFSTIKKAIDELLDSETPENRRNPFITFQGGDTGKNWKAAEYGLNREFKVEIATTETVAGSEKATTKTVAGATTETVAGFEKATTVSVAHDKESKKETKKKKLLVFSVTDPLERVIAEECNLNPDNLTRGQKEEIEKVVLWLHQEYDASLEQKYPDAEKRSRVMMNHVRKFGSWHREVEWKGKSPRPRWLREKWESFRKWIRNGKK